MSLLSDLGAYLREARASDRAVKPAPSRNRYGVRAVDLGLLEAGDVVDVTLGFLPGDHVRAVLLGSAQLLIPHPVRPGNTCVLIRDADGAPGQHITSLSYVCHVSELDEDDDE